MLQEFTLAEIGFTVLIVKLFEDLCMRCKGDSRIVRIAANAVEADVEHKRSLLAMLEAAARICVCVLSTGKWRDCGGHTRYKGLLLFIGVECACLRLFSN